MVGLKQLGKNQVLNKNKVFIKVLNQQEKLTSNNVKHTGIEDRGTDKSQKYKATA